MAYDPNNLSALTYANGFTLWHYATDDSFREFAAPDYFAEAKGMLRNCDVILVSMNRGTDYPSVSILFVGNDEDGVVVAGYLDHLGRDHIVPIQRCLTAIVDRLDTIEDRLEGLEEEAL